MILETKLRTRVAQVTPAVAEVSDAVNTLVELRRRLDRTRGPQTARRSQPKRAHNKLRHTTLVFLLLKFDATWRPMTATSHGDESLAVKTRWDRFPVLAAGASPAA